MLGTSCRVSRGQRSLWQRLEAFLEEAVSSEEHPGSPRKGPRPAPRDHPGVVCVAE